MRILVYSDIHLHTWSYGSSLVEGGFNSRLVDQIDVIKQMKDYCLNNNIYRMICCGDVFHTQGKVDAEVLTAAHSIFSEINCEGIDQLWLVGNHDQKNKSGTIHSLSFLKEIGTVVDDMYYNPEGYDFPFACLAYTESEEKIKEFFKSITEGRICFIHQGVNSVPQFHGFTIEEIFKPEMIPDHIRHVFAGHYHDFNRVNNKLTIPGAPMQHTCGDSNVSKGWLDVNIPETGEIEIKHIESKHPKLVKEPKEKEAESKVVLTAADFDRLDDLVRDFVQQKKMNQHAIKIGQEIMEGKYEAPTTGS